MTKEPIPSLSIGMVVGGSSEKTIRWEAGLRILTRRIIEAEPGSVSPLKLNVVFHVPGHIVTPDYEGVRTAIYSRKDSLLMIQVAVPSEAPVDVEEYLFGALSQAFDEAERWARDRRVPHDIDSFRSLLANLMQTDQSKR